jgi:hypothetical protein
MSYILKVAVIVVVMGSAVMAAQPVAPPPPAPPASSSASPAQPGVPPVSDVDISVRQRSVLSPADMVKQAGEYVTRLDLAIKQVQAAADSARKQKDVIRLNCLLDRLAQLRANKSIADQARRSLEEAAARHDEGASLHEYTRITIINQKAQVLGADAQACVGEELAYVGATRVDVEVDGVPPGDFTQPWPLGRPFDRPPAASPFQ